MNRTNVAVYGLLTIVVLSIFNLLLDVLPVKFPDIASFDKHVAQVRPSLPRDGVIGYYTDFTDAPGAKDALREFNLVQYALAPVVIDKSTDRKLVVSSLHNPQNPIPNRDLELLRDFGSGIKLFRNRAK